MGSHLLHVVRNRDVVLQFGMVRGFLRGLQRSGGAAIAHCDGGSIRRAQPTPVQASACSQDSAPTRPDPWAQLLACCLQAFAESGERTRFRCLPDGREPRGCSTSPVTVYNATFHRASPTTAIATCLGLCSAASRCFLSSASVTECSFHCRFLQSRTQR